MTEKKVHQQVCDYLKMQYPNVIFTSDASGMRVSMGLRMELKRKRCNRFVIPDLIILHPNKSWHGLIIEIKNKASEWYNKDGVIKINNEHIYKQWQSLYQLSKLNYCAEVGVGFDGCRRIIDNYFGKI